jgi:GxxExxY protein
MSTDFLYKDLTYKIIGVLFEVHKTLGPVHKENIYHEAIKYEFELQNIPYVDEKP